MGVREFDVIVVGAGPAGEIVAGRIAERSDLSVAIVERHLIGGECSFYACMPSKALLRPQELARELGRVPGVAPGAGKGLDVEAILSRRDEVIHDLDDSGQLPWLDERGIKLFRGQAAFSGERELVVGNERLVARRAVVLAVGSGALVPPIPGLREAATWTNREITTAKAVPERLLVLGGGVVGVEMAQAWSSLGSSVAIIEGEKRLVSREEPFAGELLAETFTGLGIEVHLGVKASAVSQGDQQTTVELEDGTSLNGSHLLVAIGRAPHTRELGLEVLGLDPGASVQVNDRLRCPSHDWLYAVGDVNGRSLLTHMGKYQARIAADVIMGDEKARLVSDGAESPRVIFTDPQIAAVGLTLAGAKEAGMEAEAIDLETSGTAGASFYGRNADGTTRFVVDRSRDLLVGATFAGPETAEFVHAATIAIVGGVTMDRLVHAVPSFPTRSELWLNLIEAYGL